jgi:hypothetical protein
MESVRFDYVLEQLLDAVFLVDCGETQSGVRCLVFRYRSAA